MNEFILLLVINAALALGVITYWRKSNLESNLLDMGKYIFVLLMGWIGFSILFGLMSAFDKLESSKTFSNHLLMGDVVVVLRFIAVGLGLTFLLTWITVRFSKRLRQKNSHVPFKSG